MAVPIAPAPPVTTAIRPCRGSSPVVMACSRGRVMTGESAGNPAALARRARPRPAMSWLSSFERRGFVYSVASAVSGCGCPFDDAAQAVRAGVVADDHGPDLRRGENAPLVGLVHA